MFCEISLYSAFSVQGNGADPARKILRKQKIIGKGGALNLGSS